MPSLQEGRLLVEDLWFGKWQVNEGKSFQRERKVVLINRSMKLIGIAFPKAFQVASRYCRSYPSTRPDTVKLEGPHYRRAMGARLGRLGKHRDSKVLLQWFVCVESKSINTSTEIL